MKKSKTITLTEVEVDEQGEEVEVQKEYTIKKIPVGKFAELMLAIDKLPSLVLNTLDGADLENLTQQDMLLKLPKLLAGAQDEIFSLTSVASDVETKEIAEFDIEEFIQLIETIIEVNNISAIIERVKGLGKKVKAQAK
ncbi:hypothetical protein [Virgibacillus sp. CBA3643]|uniref:hypothetical protein n=1 Tax=Virgibacillus sp. CBA3643 TaxID=2942278 RepID=UPI0035A2AC26